MHDVIIIGAGVIGCSIARELTKYKLSVLVLEKGSDVAIATSKANSAIVHAGYDAKPGTLKAKMNLAGNTMFDELSQELDFPFKRCGSLILCFDEKDMPKLEELKRRGENNGVQGLEIIDRANLEAKEPNIGTKAVAALWAPTGGIVCPYEMTVALYENARDNGAQFMFNHKVEHVSKSGDVFEVATQNSVFKSKVLINAAGVFADEIHNMISDNPINIIPRAGQYYLFDRSAGNLVNHTLFQLPSDMGKGVLVTPTIDGNLLVGPTAKDISDKNDVSTNAEDSRSILNAALLTMDNLPMREIITSFTGLRAHSVSDDFIIEESSDISAMIDVAGIESPGLTSAPAIGVHVAGLAAKILSASINSNFKPKRKGIPKFREMTNQERREIIAKNPSYGKIICRCETVTEGEVLEAIGRGAKDIDAVKRRTRAGMGRCQGGFCSPQILALLSRELGISVTQVTKSGEGSNILIGKNKEV